MIIQTIVQSTSLDNIDSELLLAHTLGKPREFIVAHPEAKVGIFDCWKFKRLIQKRKRGVPIAYLTGHKEFYGLDFVVNKDVLVPRPETEVIVDTVIDQLRITNYGLRVTFIDVGTGSGCIPISVIKTLKHPPASQARALRAGKNIKTIGIDISKKALRVAKKNAERHHVEIEFLRGDLLGPLLSRITYHVSRTKQIPQFIITANLPYLTDAQYRDEPSIHHEPKSALVADNNGLALYEKLLQQISSFVTCYVVRVMCFFEIDPSQSSRITTLINEYLPAAIVNIKKDLAGRDRVVCVQII